MIPFDKIVNNFINILDRHIIIFLIDIYIHTVFNFIPYFITINILLSIIHIFHKYLYIFTIKIISKIIYFISLNLSYIYFIIKYVLILLNIFRCFILFYIILFYML